MQNIAKGLQSRMTPEAINTAVELGKDILEQMKENDFSEVQERAIDLQTKSRGLVSNVTELISPASKLNSRVEDTGKSIEELTSRLDDLKNRTEVAAQKKATAYGLNFHNHGGEAGYTIEMINHLTEKSEKVGCTEKQI